MFKNPPTVMRHVDAPNAPIPQIPLSRPRASPSKSATNCSLPLLKCEKKAYKTCVQSTFPILQNSVSQNQCSNKLIKPTKYRHFPNTITLDSKSAIYTLFKTQYKTHEVSTFLKITRSTVNVQGQRPKAIASKQFIKPMK